MKKIAIGGGQGFWGDSPDAAIHMIHNADIQYLACDYLAELTLSIMAKQQLKDPSKGYAPDFVTRLLKTAGKTAWERNIKIVTNAGGMNISGCVNAIRQYATEENMKGYKKQRKFRRIIALILILIGIMTYRTIKTDLQAGELKLPSIVHQKADTSLEWNLILVNYNHYIPDDYQVELTELSNGKKVDSRIYPDLQQMFNDARSEGLSLFVREGYRTAEEQQQIMNDKIEEYENQGCSRKEAKKMAEEYVAVPGTSEHQLGLSVDINADTTKSSSDEVYQWLDENAYKYGFVKRYPSDKTDITGINNEPWHYRYVGKEAAEIIKKENLCLEEYVEQYT